MAVESYLEDFDDLGVALERLRDPADEAVDWQEARLPYSLKIKRSALKEIQSLPKDVYR